MTTVDDVDLSVKIAGVKFKNPVMPASGCFGYGKEISQLYNLSLLGGLMTKGTTLLPREGNPPPRVVETSAGLINWIGLENPGVELVMTDVMPFLKSFDVVVILNISGLSTEDYVGAVQVVMKSPKKLWPDFIEVNISCPNVKSGGVAFGQNPELASALVSKLKALTPIPLIVKLTPNVTDIVAIARAVVGAKADALSLINTLQAMGIINNGPNKGKAIIGGLSGPCIKPVALYKVWQIFQAKLGVPIIGMGGISSLHDALEFFSCGADAIAVGTGLFPNPMLMLGIIDGLKKKLAEDGCANFEDWKSQNRLKM